MFSESDTNEEIKMSVDYMPVKGLCKLCKWYQECPYDYMCSTLKRVIFEDLDNDNPENGDW